jgi:hypothetical protein
MTHDHLVLAWLLAREAEKAGGMAEVPQASVLLTLLFILFHCG